MTTPGYHLSTPTGMEASQDALISSLTYPQCPLKQCTSYAHYTYLHTLFLLYNLLKFVEYIQQFSFPL